jgi:hypothetical protein
MYINISSVDYTSVGGNKFMAMIVDDYSQMKWSFFMKQKSYLTLNVLPFIKELKSNVINIETVGTDNTGENKTLGNEQKKLMQRLSMLHRILPNKVVSLNEQYVWTAK